MERVIFKIANTQTDLFSPKKTYLCVCTFEKIHTNHTPYVFDTKTGRIICSPLQANHPKYQWKGDENPYRDSMDFSPEETKLILYDNNLLWIFNFSTQEWKIIPLSGVKAVRFIDENRVICPRKGGIVVLNVETGDIIVDVDCRYTGLRMCHLDHERRVLVGFSKKYNPASNTKLIKKPKNKLYCYALELDPLINKQVIYIHLIHWFRCFADIFELLFESYLGFTRGENINLDAKEIIESCTKVEDFYAKHDTGENKDIKSIDSDEESSEESGEESNEDSDDESSEVEISDDDGTPYGNVSDDEKQDNGVYDKTINRYVQKDYQEIDKSIHIIEVFDHPTKFYLSKTSNNFDPKIRHLEPIGQTRDKIFYTKSTQDDTHHLGYLTISSLIFGKFAEIVVCGLADNGAWGSSLKKGIYDPRLLIYIWSFIDLPQSKK